MNLEQVTEAGGREVSIAEIRQAKRADNVIDKRYEDPLVAAFTAIEICLGTFINSAYREHCQLNRKR